MGHRAGGEDEILFSGPSGCTRGVALTAQSPEPPDHCGPRGRISAGVGLPPCHSARADLAARADREDPPGASPAGADYEAGQKIPIRRRGWTHGGGVCTPFGVQGREAQNTNTVTITARRPCQANDGWSTPFRQDTVCCNPRDRLKKTRRRSSRRHRRPMS